MLSLLKQHPEKDSVAMSAALAVGMMTTCSKSLPEQAVSRAGPGR